MQFLYFTILVWPLISIFFQIQQCANGRLVSMIFSLLGLISDNETAIGLEDCSAQYPENPIG